MNKKAILEEKRKHIKDIQQEIESIKNIELRRLYKIKESGLIAETYGYFKHFNRESVRFCVVASDYPSYDDTKFGYIGLRNCISQAKKSDLPLLFGMRYKSIDLEKILKGKKRIKINA